jgi:hypothetical protein
LHDGRGCCAMLESACVTYRWSPTLPLRINGRKEGNDHENDDLLGWAAVSVAGCAVHDGGADGRGGTGGSSPGSGSSSAGIGGATGDGGSGGSSSTGGAAGYDGDDASVGSEGSGSGDDAGTGTGGGSTGLGFVVTNRYDNAGARGARGMHHTAAWARP